MATKAAQPRIKICGITDSGDAVHACESGADAIGLVFYAPSPRAVSIGQAREIAQAVGPFTTLVGLFVDAQPDEVEKVLQQVPLHVLQFHGSEDAAYCTQFQRPWIKALRIKPDTQVESAMADYAAASGILVDSYKPGVPGGTGETFDWSLLPASIRHSLVLAGGLNPDNVADAIRTVKPCAVDVSGGVESAPGKKDRGKISAFIEAVRNSSE